MVYSPIVPLLKFATKMSCPRAVAAENAAPTDRTNAMIETRKTVTDTVPAIKRFIFRLPKEKPKRPYYGQEIPQCKPGRMVYA